MRTRTLLVLASVVALPAFAQVEINVQLPTITFSAPPPLVVVEPGVQVVEDNDEEVYFVDNYYWVRRGPRWYRTRDHHGGWVVVDGPGVPAAIVRVPEGKYRRFKNHKDEGQNESGKGKSKEKHHGKH